jgi:hypothetical protein
VSESKNRDEIASRASMSPRYTSVPAAAAVHSLTMRARRELVGIALVSGVLGTGAFVGCGDSAEGEVSSNTGGVAGDAGGDSSTATGGASTGGAPGDAAADTAPPPTKTPYDPCSSGSCWSAPTLGACGALTTSQTYSSGLYNVHRYLLMAPAGVEIEIVATRTGGTWSPALVVHDSQGLTVHDGQKSYSTPALDVSAITPPPSSDAVGVRLVASARMHVAVFVTSDAVLGSQLKDSLPTDAKYTLSAKLGCTPAPPLTVRGVTLDGEQELWVRYIAEHVVPLVPGTEAERIEKSALVTWWALKEGVLNVNNPLSYSNCSIPPDKHIGPIETCPNPNNAWQVGLSGVQAAYRTLDSVEKLAASVFPARPLGELLTEAAVTAGFGSGTAIGQAITGAQDRLRLSWLLRSSPVGFEAQYPPVRDQCFKAPTKAWCFGTGWPSSASFAPNQTGANESVDDLKKLFQQLAP